MSSTSSAATSSTIRTDADIQLCLNNIPLPPPNYQFSKQQRDAQIEFFRNHKDEQLPDLPLNLYDASVIVVLPTNTSAVLRQFFASLFITHGQTKLNSIGNLLVDNTTNSSYPFGLLRGNWCHNLINRPSLMRP